jgi:hypothetical protein
MMESKVLSKTPGSKSFTGFQRQLNYFGFRRVFGGKALPGKQTMYSNPLFRRDHPEELTKIQRQDKGKRKCTPVLPEKAVAETEVESPMVEGQLCEQSVQPQGLPPPAESGEPLSWTSTGMALGDGACAEMGLCGSGWCVVVWFEWLPEVVHIKHPSGSSAPTGMLCALHAHELGGSAAVLKAKAGYIISNK